MFHRAVADLTLQACKIVSIALVEAPADAEIDYETPKLSEIPARAAEIWNPGIPEGIERRCDWAVSSPSAAAPAQPFNLCLDMDFGGPDGRLLGGLTRISVVLGGYPAVLVGMAFDYADGSRRAHGRRDYLIENKHHVSGVEQTFFIDGPGGERLTAVEVANSPRQSAPQDLGQAAAPGPVQGITVRRMSAPSRRQQQAWP